MSAVEKEKRKRASTFVETTSRSTLEAAGFVEAIKYRKCRIFEESLLEFDMKARGEEKRGRGVGLRDRHKRGDEESLMATVPLFEMDIK